ncbi:cytochrome c oxidase protein 20 homolog [Trichogramma pretiosum]|uniref:cytochrome c oxidase protein 20 homolog n=1 Tax=Trichogramma pretiosum TaxID=7493 RepID=UPI0006C9E216|nr:cytochrome c oxidase protein 20 homolog [Trichogramma pretiosum]
MAKPSDTIKIEGALDEEPKRASLVIFGRDLFQIPCFRTTFLYSISSYVGVSLLTFLFTSKPKMSSHVGFVSFMAVTFGYFTKCRTDLARERLQIGEVQKALLPKSENKLEETNRPVLDDA